MCRDFGVSRKTGCKIFDRCKEHGQGRTGRSVATPMLATWCYLRVRGRTFDLLATLDEDENYVYAIAL